MADIVRAVASAAATQPGRPGIAAGDEHLDLGAVVAGAGGLAVAIGAARGTDLPPRAPVLLAMTDGVSAAVGALGIMAAGHPVIPVDARIPDAALGAIVFTTRAAAVIAAPDALRDRPAVRHLVRLPPRGHPPADLPYGAIEPGDVAVLAATSGSTGDPRQHPRTHRDLFQRLERADAAAPRPGQHLGCLLGATAATVRRLLFALATGVAVTCLDARALPPVDLLRRFRAAGVDALQLVPTHLRRLLAAVDIAPALPALRLLHAGAEPLGWEDVARVRRSLAPEVTVVHTYGCTEAGRVAERTVPPSEALGTGRLPVGWPPTDVEVRLVDDVGREVEQGEVGRVEVTRVGRAPVTVADLARRRSDGQLELVGRDDGMVKVGGIRIETTAVEEAVRALPAVADAVVVTTTTEDGLPVVDVHVVPAGDDDAGLADAARRATDGLEHARGVVTRIHVHVGGLPQVPGGKADRRRLSAVTAIG